MDDGQEPPRKLSWPERRAESRKWYGAEEWIAAIRVSAVRVLLALRVASGGWRALHAWAWEGAKELAWDLSGSARRAWRWFGAASPWQRGAQAARWLGRRRLIVVGLGDRWPLEWWQSDWSQYK